MSTPSRATPWTKKLYNEEAKIGRTLAGGHIPSVAKAVMSHPQLREAVILNVLDRIDNECTQLCKATSPPSLFCQLPVSELDTFQWDKFIQELQAKAPLLLQVLCTVTSHNDHRNKSKRGIAHYPGICMAAAVILKERSQKMTGIQSLVSMILFAFRQAGLYY